MRVTALTVRLCGRTVDVASDHVGTVYRRHGRHHTLFPHTLVTTSKHSCPRRTKAPPTQLIHTQIKPTNMITPRYQPPSHPQTHSQTNILPPHPPPRPLHRRRKGLFRQTTKLRLKSRLRQSSFQRLLEQTHIRQLRGVVYRESGE